jgi:ubiquinone/menaquinone biosynthesis C-methylase UbiE
VQNDQLRSDAMIYDRRAASYGTDPNDLVHSIPPALEEPYRLDLEEVLGIFNKFQSVLEVGAGNGVFTQLLAKWGCADLTGTDISPGMLKQARTALPDCEFTLLSEEADPTLFPSASFDLIISRQVACHFLDPIAVFDCWHRWLKPGGRAVVIDGLWTRQDWGPPTTAAGALVDQRPLSCTQTWATVCYLLQRSNFVIHTCRLLERVNSFAKNHFNIGDRREPVFRFAVVAGLQ